ncbi:putative bifunctional diguanylate cyclase/phosphodiesterase [Aureimonas sp. AU40]|uniref:putative bifunctional diguanylate cyclase/phosphodiesterase n=1 Tax=Aureimonas sp. AU40 TaxID=1637747 RepID=UPI000A997BEB|nr:GGDEF domain-containing phosphodiesterase [Aureimonas sp. AU40]
MDYTPKHSAPSERLARKDFAADRDRRSEFDAIGEVCRRYKPTGHEHVLTLEANRRLTVTNLPISDHMYRLMVEAVTDYAIYMLDPNGVVQSWNRGARLAKGYDADEIVGRSFALFYSEKERLRSIPELNLQHARDHGRFTEDGWRLRKDGTKFWANVVIDAIHDENRGLVGFTKITRDLTAQRETELQLAHQAGHDALTGLFNRSKFLERLDDEVPQLIYGARLAVHYIDLDRFKPVNDAFGHAVGDQVLRTIGERLQAVIPIGSIVARLGGDEFAVLQFGSPTIEDASELSCRIVQTLSEPISVRNAIVVVGASVGVAHAPIHGCEAAELLRNSDLALYAAKQNGRGRFEIYDPSMNAQALSRGVMELKLRQALKLHDFELHYQPVVDARTLVVVGYEALLRWQDQTGKQVSPAHFIPLAEELGLMPELGAWVLRTACRDASSWPTELVVAVNVSAMQLRDRGFVEVVKATLAATRLPACRLELEVTETAVLADPTLANEILSELRDLGVGIALDDFGTGFSSLRMVKELPLTRIKIDRSFVSGINETSKSTSVIRSIITLCEAYGLSTTAEGVETAQQLTELQRQNCDHLQGFLLGRAQPDAFWRSFRKEQERGGAEQALLR